MINFMLENWYMILIAIFFVILVISMLINLFKHPGELDLAKIKEWLLWAVSLAEKELGSGTGQLKLRYVYDMFVSKFPTFITQYITFEKFSSMVDEALAKMNELIDKNIQIHNYIEESE